MKKLLLTLALLVSTSLLQAKSETSVNQTMKFSDINGKTYQVQGNEEGLKIAGMEGKVIFLEFFGHRCPPCLKMVPRFTALQEKYKNKVQVLAVEVQGLKGDKLKSFIKTKKINYPVAEYYKAKTLVDYIAKRAQWSGAIPFTVVLDTKGEVQFVHLGMFDNAQLEDMVTKLSKK